MEPYIPPGEIHFQSIFQALPGNYLILKPNPPVYTIIAVSDAYAANTLTRREDILSRGLFDVFPDNPEDPNATGVNNLAASLSTVIRERKPHKMAIQKYDIHVEGQESFEERYWNPLNTPVLDEHGDVRFIIHQVDDVTEKVRTSDALNRQTEELKKTNAKLVEFVRISSHDLQEPLRKIRTFGELLNYSCKTSLDKNALELSTKMVGAAERMSARLKGLLEYAYLTRDTTFTPVHLVEIFAEVMDDLSLVLEEKQASIEAEPLPVVAGIRQQLHQLFYNLLSNALKFSKKSERPEIRIGVKEFAASANDNADSQRFCELTFADNGIGFEQRHAQRIFTIFERLDASKTEAGTGMGLAFCKMVVENHGGEISARSEPGAGATFHVMLPVL